MKWKQVFQNWENGNPLKIPKSIKKPFIWRSSVLDRDGELEYKDEFIEDKRFIGRDKEILGTMEKELKNRKYKNEKYVIDFPNLSGDTMLVVPTQRQNKNFTSIFYFYNTASKLQIKKVWQRVAKIAKKQLKIHPDVFISTHGLGVDYLHIRICSYPKYYEKSTLQKIPKLLR